MITESLLLNNTETIKTHWKSSMGNIRITKNNDKETYTLTIIDDVSHGHRTFVLYEKDISLIFEVFQSLK